MTGRTLRLSLLSLQSACPRELANRLQRGGSDRNIRSLQHGSKDPLHWEHMKLFRGLLAVGLLIWLTGCTVTNHVADSSFRPPRGNYKLLVMQPDISVGVLTAGGAFEFREDWTT